MHPVIRKTFGGLSKGYYFRQLFFSMFPAIILIIFGYFTFGYSLQGILSIFIPVCMAFLYPYSRFVYESIVDFIIGDHIITAPIAVMIMTKWMTISFCFCLSFFIAPVGLAYLYYYNSRQEKNAQD